VIIIAGLKLAKPIVVPVFIAFFLAVLTSPAVTLLVNNRVPKGIAISFVVFILFGVFYGIGSLVATSSDQFIERIPDYEAQFNSWLTIIDTKIPWLLEDLKSRFTDFKPTQSTLGILGSLFSGLGSVLTTIVLVLFTLIFTLLETQSASKKIKLALNDNHTLDYINKFSKLVQRYLLVKSLISLATGLLVALLLWLLDIDYPILWGTLAFLMNFIPNIGSLIAAVPPILLALIQKDLPGFFVVGSGLFAINIIIGNLIEPRLMGKTLDISPLVVFLSLVFWGWVLGPIGMLLAIPLTVIVKIGMEVYPKTRWLAQMISQ